MNDRYCIVSDNDGHDYCILTTQVDDFYEWVDWCESDTCEDLGYFDFNEARIGGNLTFENPTW